MAVEVRKAAAKTGTNFLGYAVLEIENKKLEPRSEDIRVRSSEEEQKEEDNIWKKMTSFFTIK